MKRYLFITILLFVSFFPVKALFSATFDLTGTWNYTLSNNWAHGGIECNPDHSASGICAIEQTGNTFTFAYTSGVVCSPAGVCSYEGTIDGAVYTCSTTEIVDNEGGSFTGILVFTASSATSASGSGTSEYTHPSGLWECRWGNTITLTRSGSISGDNDGDGYTPGGGDCNDNDATIYPDAPEVCGDGIDQDCDGGDDDCEPVYDATGDWDFTQTLQNTDCPGDIENFEEGSLSINQSDRSFSLIKDGNTFTGTIDEATYSGGGAYSEDGENFSVTFTIDLSSNKAGTGTVHIIAESGSNRCSADYQFSISIKESDDGSGGGGCFISKTSI